MCLFVCRGIHHVLAHLWSRPCTVCVCTLTRRPNYRDALTIINMGCFNFVLMYPIFLGFQVFEINFFKKSLFDLSKEQQGGVEF